MNQTPETARALLDRHGLPEDVIDGALCLHAQELAAVQRREADDLHQTEPGVVKGLRIGADLIDPTKGPAASAVVSPPTDRAAVLSEAERTMLAYALDQAQERIWSEDGFTDEDQAAVDSLRRLAVEAHDTGTQQPECTASISGNCLAEAQSERPCDTDDGECVHGGRPAGTQQPSGPVVWLTQSAEAQQQPDTEALTPRCDHCKQPGHSFEDCPRDDEPAPVAQQPAAEVWVCKCPAGLCGCGHHAPTEQQAAAADGEETPSRAVLLELVRDFLDPDPCSFDHHGYCQAHGWLGGEPGSCPHGRARKLIPGIDEDATP